MPVLLRARSDTKEPLYLPADSHWSPAGRAVCVRMLAERIGRYRWAREAKRGTALYTAAPANLSFFMSYLSLLTVEEKAAVEPYLTPPYDRIFLPSGKPSGNFESAPVMIIGDSYSELPGPQLAHALNLPVAMMPVPGGTVPLVKELMRNRLALGEARVVVWILNYANFCLHDWTGVPEAVKKEWRCGSRESQGVLNFSGNIQLEPKGSPFMIQMTTFLPSSKEGSRNISWKVWTMLPATWLTVTG